MTIIASNLGDVVSQHFLMVQNMEENGIAQWEVIVQ
jgi:hypothetical protein